MKHIGYCYLDLTPLGKPTANNSLRVNLAVDRWPPCATHVFNLGVQVSNEVGTTLFFVSDFDILSGPNKGQPRYR